MELENRESPQQSDIDKEGITDDEKYMLRKIGLKMKPFLLLGSSLFFLFFHLKAICSRLSCKYMRKLSCSNVSCCVLKVDEASLMEQ